MFCKLFIILVLASFLGSCSLQPALQGTYSKDGEQLALLRLLDNGKFDTLEVVTTSSGRFSFSVKPEIPNLYYLALLDQSWKIPLLLDSPSYQIDVPSLQNVSIKGGSTQDYLNSLSEKLKILQQQHSRIGDSLKLAQEKSDASSVMYWQQEQNKLKESILSTENQAIKEHSNDLVGVFLIWQRMKLLSDADLEAKYTLLSDSMQGTFGGRLIFQEIDRRWNLVPGVKARDFTLSDINGNPVSLFKTNAKVKLLDFWASWCMPCRQENKKLVDIYKRYKDKGLEIISISSDKQEKNWRNAIEKDGYTWIQLLDPDKGKKGGVFGLYKVTGIPRWFLLDSNNNCIAEGRTGEGLEEMIQNELGL